MSPLFNEDESLIILQIAKAKKKHFINAYDINSSNLVYSNAVNKKYTLFGQSRSKKLLYVGGKINMKGYPHVDILDSNTGEMLAVLKSEKTWYKNKPLIDPDLFVSISLASRHK